MKNNTSRALRPKNRISIDGSRWAAIAIKWSSSGFLGFDGVGKAGKRSLWGLHFWESITRINRHQSQACSLQIKPQGGTVSYHVWYGYEITFCVNISACPKSSGSAQMYENGPNFLKISSNPPQTDSSKIREKSASAARLFAGTPTLLDRL